jgi:hypothetical protein
MGNGAEVEVSDVADQYISGGEVENAPHHVDGRRGKALTGRLSEMALKGPSDRPTGEVGNGIGKKRAAKEIGDVKRNCIVCIGTCRQRTKNPPVFSVSRFSATVFIMFGAFESF